MPWPSLEGAIPGIVAVVNIPWLVYKSCKVSGWVGFYPLQMAVFIAYKGGGDPNHLLPGMILHVSGGFSICWFIFTLNIGEDEPVLIDYILLFKGVGLKPPTRCLIC